MSKGIRHRDRTRASAVPTFVLGLCGFAGFVTEANADSLLITDVSTSNSAGVNTYTYTIGLGAHSALYKPPSSASSAGGNWSADFIEVFDFAGLQGAVQFTPDAQSGLSRADFAVATPLSDNAAISASFAGGRISTAAPLTAGEVTRASFGDDPSLGNLKASFDRTTPLVNNSAKTIILGALTAKSLYDPDRYGLYLSTDTDASGNTRYTAGMAQTPLAPNAAPAAPLPGVIWGGAGLLGIVKLKTFRRAKR